MLYSTVPAHEKRRVFRERLASGELLRFPGAFNPLSARLIEQKGFEGVYISGAVLSADLGLPDIGLTTLTEVAARSRQIARVTNLPVLVDAGIGTAYPATKETPEQFREVIDVNLNGCYWMAQACGRVMQPGASIINISSIAGLAAAPGMGAYNATKAAVWMYTKTLALEAAKAEWNVRCNSVHPVFIKTPILDPFVAMAGGDEAKAHERLSRGIPLKRIGEPDDVAYCVLYLASDESKFVTGSEFKIDGGMTAQ